MSGPAASRILVVDDEADLAAILGNRLRRAGYEVSVATDGLEALEMIRREPPALVLLDVRMPRLDGLETLRRIRGEGGPARLPVIVMTANADPADRARALECGADECLAKPFETAEMLARIRALVGAPDGERASGPSA